ncbi:MAG TPA: sensor domain-containing protein [Streptosporangiaceae bacterium]|nr:sensor domain-containing protein [Streptosporangiaceae bacterium]
MSSQRAPSAQGAGPPGDSRLTLRHNPIGLIFSASLWQSAGYLFSSLIVSTLLFAVAFSTSMLALVFGITVAALPLLIAAAAVIRGCASVERFMLRQVFTRPVTAHYPAALGGGLWRQARARWGQATTWRDLGYLVGLWAPLFALDAVVFALWTIFLAGVSLPLWYSHAKGVCVGYCNGPSVSGVLIGDYPHGPHVPGDHGLWVHSLSTAVLAAAGSVILFLLFNYVLVGTARLHAQVASALLRRPADPLAQARAVLAGPGPLGPLIGTEPSGQGLPDDRLLR